MSTASAGSAPSACCAARRANWSDHEPQESAREQAEGMRVAYVAATRARDLLVVPAVGDEAFPDGGWLSPLNKAIYPSHADWRKSQPADGCPKFGQASVIERPLDYAGEGEFSVKPGLHPSADTASMKSSGGIRRNWL